MRKWLLGLALSLFAALAPTAAPADGPQSPVAFVYCWNGSVWAPCSASNPMFISGSFSATLSPFTPSASGARGTPVAVTTSDSSGTLPTGTAVAVTNVGSNPMYCNVNGVAATTSDQFISAGGGYFEFGIPTGITALHCIATGGSTTANMVGGTGLASGAAAGSGGGGGGTVAQGSQGSAGAAWYVQPGTSATWAVTGTFWPYTLGQQLAAASVPVVLTAAQLTTLTPPAAITNYANETGGNLAQIVTDFGPPGSTACTTDTASCNQNQQLQRLAQRLTSIVSALGSPFQAGGALAANQSVNVTQFGGSNVVTGTGVGGSGIPRVTVSSDSFPATQPVQGQANVTPTDCSVSVTTGGTAQNIITAGSSLHGFCLGNIDASSGSGEPVWMSLTGTATAGATASFPLSAPTATTYANMSSFCTPPGFGTNANVSVLAATTGHKISCTKW